MSKKRQRQNLEEEDLSIDPSSREFIYDAVDDYNQIGKESEDDADDSENEFEGASGLVSKNKRKEQVLGLDLDSSEDDNNDDDDDDNLSDDIESSENEYNNDQEGMSMGRRRKDYYGTDITDQRLYNIGRRKTKKKGQEEALQIELEGAYELQNRYQAQKAHVFDFDSEFAEPKSGETLEEKLEAEYDESSKKEISKSKQKTKKKKISEKPSDFDALSKEVCAELQCRLIPLIEALKNGILPESFDAEYLRTRFFLCLNFLTTYSSEKMLIAAETDMEGHSVEKRLVQYRELFKTLNSCNTKFESELDSLLADLKSGKLRKKKRKLLSVVKPKGINNKFKTNEKEETIDENEEEEMNLKNGEMESEDGDESEVEENTKVSGNTLESAEGKRPITYEIAKNKGLMPTRKKEQRNPRVKYKRKFQDKIKRRKGQVRTVRTEVKRYDGEISGINKNVVKSRKLK